ncbi:Uncharacterized protein APZ42_009629 [Daphnia magna]|uniref:Uncharacterized protein n=1 Tax=Daphnia magna TaxID=35525 RepID=A0A164DWL8_9CRUS|nr:Uncharacterized protein APZ42_009629 [Daphnia magna]
MQRGNEANQDQASHGRVEPPGHVPGENVQFNVAPNDPFLGVPDVPPLIHVGNFKERDPPVFRGLPHEDVTSENQVKEKTPKVVRWCDRQSRAVDQEQHCEKDASSTTGLRDERVGGHVLRSRRRLKSPTRLDL